MADQQIQHLLIEPNEFVAQLNRTDQVVVDLSRPDIYAQVHLPGAVHLDYAQIVRHQPPVMGLLPSEEGFARTLNNLGITPDLRVVAYDDEGGGKAARLLWTLEAAGYTHLALLDGGLKAWLESGLTVDNKTVSRRATNVPIGFVNMDVVADCDYILSRLSDPDVVIVDTRTPNEFAGTDVRAARGGHIPGAVNFDWVNAMDSTRGLRVKPHDELIKTLADMGVAPNKEVIVHCQSHHRSAHTFFVLKTLGFRKVRGYPGAWSDWASRADTPVEK